jgi:hypothetical protein
MAPMTFTRATVAAKIAAPEGSSVFYSLPKEYVLSGELKLSSAFFAEFIIFPAA